MRIILKNKIGLQNYISDICILRIGIFNIIFNLYIRFY